MINAGGPGTDPPQVVSLPPEPPSIHSERTGREPTKEAIDDDHDDEVEVTSINPSTEPDQPHLVAIAEKRETKLAEPVVAATAPEER